MLIIGKFKKKFIDENIINTHKIRIIPESIRWLLAKKENQKAGAIIRKAAAINGVQLSEVILSKFEEQSEHLNEVKKFH